MEDQKTLAARAALKYIRPNTILGLGTGSTASIFIRLLAERSQKENLNLTCVSTSIASTKLAQELGLKVVSLVDIAHIDSAIDGADMVDEKLNLIKGYGGALTREKVVDYEAREFIVIVDSSKCKPLEGEVPLEVIPFAIPSVQRSLSKLGISSKMRVDEGKPFITDNGNNLLHANMRIENAEEMEKLLNQIPGVVENGIFTKCTRVIIAGASNIEIKERKRE
ncbi:MAG: ribose-5-phosphate isomerase RpiA [Candidatus Micrarchaeota archaeon]